MFSTGFYQALGGVLVFLLALGTAVGTWAALRTGRQSQIIQNYKEAANSWKETSEARESEVKQLRAEIQESKRAFEQYQVMSTSRIAELETQVTILQNIVTAREEFDYLNGQVKGLKEDTSAILSLLTKEPK